MLTLCARCMLHSVCGTYTALLYCIQHTPHTTIYRSTVMNVYIHMPWSTTCCIPYTYTPSAWTVLLYESHYTLQYTQCILHSVHTTYVHIPSFYTPTHLCSSVGQHRAPFSQNGSKTNDSLCFFTLPPCCATSSVLFTPDSWLWTPRAAQAPQYAKSVTKQRYLLHSRSGAGEEWLV